MTIDEIYSEFKNIYSKYKFQITRHGEIRTINEFNIINCKIKLPLCPIQAAAHNKTNKVEDNIHADCSLFDLSELDKVEIFKAADCRNGYNKNIRNNLIKFLNIVQDDSNDSMVEA